MERISLKCYTLPMSILSEFREFAVKGNAVDLAVGVVIGASFQKIVNSLVNDILMPPLGALTGGVEFQSLFLNLSSTPVHTIAEAKEKNIPVIAYGLFINEMVSFLFVAVALFMFVKMINRLRRVRAKKADMK